MKIPTIIITFLLTISTMLKAQTMQSFLEIKYNQTSCLYEAHLHTQGNITPIDNLLATSGFCIVVPASVPNTPITCTSLSPGTWTDNTPVYNVQTFDGIKDYHKFATMGAQFNPPLYAGADIILFTFSLPNSVCPDGVRMFENNSPSPSPTPDTNPPGLTFDNSLQTLTGETYTGNTGSAVALPMPQITASCAFSCNLSTLYLYADGNTSLGCNTLTYQWSGPGGYTSSQQNPTANPFTVPGNYIVTVTDVNNCSATSSVPINNQPLTLQATIASITHVACYGQHTGSISATASGGNPPYSYTWNTTPVQNSATAQNLAAGTYSVTITDAMGCSSTATTKISQPASALSSSATVVNTSCQNANGSVNLTVTGGRDPYSFIWSNGITSEDLTNVAAGTFSVTITDSGNCQVTNTAVVINNGNPPLTPVITQHGDTLCSSATTGNQWYNNNGLITGEIYSTILPGTPGNYYVVVTNNENCVSGPSNIISYPAGNGHTISGKTRYVAKANPGNPFPNQPTYNPVKYNINKVVVKLKTSPGGAELARDTSDASGIYSFANVPDGNYILSYDKYTADTMQMGNDINSIDVAIALYFIGHDTLLDPTRNFSAKHKKAINVDNNSNINSIDIARLKSKIGQPNLPAANFPKGNWVAIDTMVTVAGANLNITLQTICYGDFNASSYKYKDSTYTWSQAKSWTKDNIIIQEPEALVVGQGAYFEVPLRITSAIDDFSAMDLSLTYPDENFFLTNAYMPRASKSSIPLKINPTLEEVIAGNNDLLVTDTEGNIRVVYATTDFFDVYAQEEIIVLCFRARHDDKFEETVFALNGSGLLADQYGTEKENVYLSVPEIKMQKINTETKIELSAYPNPFNDNSSIYFNIPESGTVSLRVFNAEGRQVAEVLNNNFDAGNHSVIFSQKNLPHGLYFFRLDFTGNKLSESVSLKMMR